VVGDAFGRGVRAVGSREGVVDIEVAQIGQLLGEDRIIGFFRRMEAHILKQQHAARIQIADGLDGGAADAVVGEADGCAEHVFQRFDNRLQAHRRDALALGTVEVGQQNHLGARVAQTLDRRHGDPQPGVVRDLAALHRDIEVHADQSRLAGEILGVVEGAEGHERVRWITRNESKGRRRQRHRAPSGRRSAAFLERKVAS
jgi:hypothetical protein